MLQGVGAVEMNAGDQPVIGISTKYQDPGVYAVEVSGPLLPMLHTQRCVCALRK